MTHPDPGGILIRDGRYFDAETDLPIANDDPRVAHLKERWLELARALGRADARAMVERSKKS